MHSWVSIDARALSDIPREPRADAEVVRPLWGGMDERVLGLTWDTRADTLEC